jgi:hypothetical protein
LKDEIFGMPFIEDDVGLRQCCNAVRNLVLGLPPALIQKLNLKPNSFNKTSLPPVSTADRTWYCPMVCTKEDQCRAKIKNFFAETVADCAAVAFLLSWWLQDDGVADGQRSGQNCFWYIG